MSLRLQNDISVSYSVVSASTELNGIPNAEGTKTPPPSPVLERNNSKPSLFSLANVAVKLNDLWTSAKDKLLGEDYWIPSDPCEVVFFPDELLLGHEIVYPNSLDEKKIIPIPSLRVVQGTIKNEPSKPLHHVVYSYSVETKVFKSLSLFRSQEMEDALDFYRRCLECKILFKFLDKSKDCRKKIRDITTMFQVRPLWKVLHIAIACQRSDIFSPDGINFLKTKNHDIKDFINVISLPEGQYPLMLAIQTNQPKIVKVLLEQGASVSQVDMNGNNALHYAALVSSNMIELLFEFEETKSILNSLNNDGFTPVLLAIRNANPICMTTLLRLGAELNPKGSGKNALFEAIASKGKGQDVIKSILEASPNLLHAVDESTGNTVIHIATHKNPLSNLLFLKAQEMNLNILNKAGQAPIHIFTNRGDLGMIMCIASYNCNLNLPNGNGDTALHIAVSNRYLEVTRLLLSLGADANVCNLHGDTPRHAAAKLNEKEILNSLMICDAKRCPPSKSGCVSGCVSESSMKILYKNSNTSSRENLVNQKNSNLNNTDKNEIDEINGDNNFILNKKQDIIYDALIKTLNGMEKDIQEGNSKYINVLSLDGGGIRGLLLIQTLIFIEKIMGEPIAPYFDWCAGTSTGALIASGLAQGKTLRECQLIYLRLKDFIFDGWVRPYNTNHLETFIKKEVGEAILLNDLKWPRLMFPTVKADIFPVQLEMMRNYKLPLSDEENIKLGYKNTDDLYLWKALRRSSAAPTFFSCVDNTYIDGGIISNNPTLEIISEIEMWNNTNIILNKEENCVKIGCLLSIGTGVIPTIPLDPNNMEISANPVALSMAIKTLGVMLVEQVTATEGAPVDRGLSWYIAMDTKDDLDLSRMMWECIAYLNKRRNYIKKLCVLIKKIGPSYKRRHLFGIYGKTNCNNMSTQTTTPELPDHAEPPLLKNYGDIEYIDTQ
ncbi:85/88 kDa calcium-independent phospholipase A2 [Strongyloides ratti]|uniref:phospholipase A2 n=1 Tax=Strongyloides ratti TaxID=34506 RepID=A0A090MPQ5_STRRB|nr:85/88 kDa calcium-independent phospholipase A2 [Strongyloides ratti]CEF60107.1 85/88 kDa calcium-independent phospholipase A2 [Strongyloides ratti]